MKSCVLGLMELVVVAWDSTTVQIPKVEDQKMQKDSYNSKVGYNALGNEINHGLTFL